MNKIRNISISTSLVAVLMVVGLCGAAEGQNQPRGTVVTIAGQADNGYNGDLDVEGKPRPSVDAELNLPWGVAVSPDGLSIYVADAGNHRVRRIDTRHWDIFTVAGNGSSDDRGDGDLAINASLRGPRGLAVDGVGNLYIADRGNHRIRMVDLDGNITTVAGIGQGGYTGDLGVATQAALNGPEDVVVDSEGNLYISDMGNSRIRKVDSNGLITTIAGNGKRDCPGRRERARRCNDESEGKALDSVLNPAGIAIDGTGGLLIADQRNERIRLLQLESGMISTYAGVGKSGFSGDGDDAELAEVANPWGVAVSSVGDAYITDTENNRIRRIRNGTIETIAGNGGMTFIEDLAPALESQFGSPYGIAVDTDGGVLVADYLNHRLRRMSTKKIPLPLHMPRTGGGVPRTVKILIGVLTGVVGWFAWDYTRPEPDLPGPPDLPLQ